jgi:hypothetical protein
MSTALLTLPPLLLAACCLHAATLLPSCSAIVNSVYRDGRIFNGNWLPVKLPELLRQFK